MALRTPLTAQPHLYIGDSTGRPLDYGRVYFGEPNKDPEFYPIDIYLDPEMTIAAAQPVRTKGGFMDVGGNLAELHAAEVVYSLKVLDQYGRQVFYKPEMYRNNVSDFLVDEITRATTAENLIAGNLTTETQRAIAAEKVISDAVVTEKDRAIAAEGLLDDKYEGLSTTIGSIGGGKKAYTTYAKMVAAAALPEGDPLKLPANSSVDITNDSDTSKNGTYAYDGTTFTRSAYDPQAIILSKVASVFNTKALMTASPLPDDSYAFVASDTITNNGYYQRKIGVWTYLGYSYDAKMKDYMTRKGVAVITPYAPTSINYDSTNYNLDFTNTIYVDSRDVKFRLTTPISLYIPNEGVYRIEANEATKTLRTAGAIADNTEGWLVCGYVIRVAGGGIVTNMFKDYLVNGMAQGSASAKTNYSLILSTPASLNFDFTGNKIDVTGDLWLAYDGGRLLISTQTVELSPTRDRGTAFQTVVMVNPKTSKLVIKEASGGYSAPKDHIVVGGYRESDLLFYGLDNFSVNGLPFNKSGGGSGGVRPAFGWSTNNKVNLNITDSITPSDALNIYNITSSKMYALYDALVAAYPDYVTKTNLGNDASGTIPIYQYRFNPKLIDPQIPAVKAVLPKIMLLSLHNESINFIYVYMLMREICKSWSGNEALTSLRFGAEFVVIPVLNPWGLDNMSRTNSNSVDINRNFPVGWIPIGAVGNAAYSGTAALTESESQIGWAAMQAEKPDIYYDCHSYGGWDGLGRSVWVSIANDKTRSAATSACTKIYAQYKQKYSWIEDMNVLMHFSNANVNDGATSAKAAQSLGVIGGNLELAWSLKNEPSGIAGHTSAVNFSSDFLGTLILQSIGVMISGSK